MTVFIFWIQQTAGENCVVICAAVRAAARFETGVFRLPLHQERRELLMTIDLPKDDLPERDQAEQHGERRRLSAERRLRLYQVNNASIVFRLEVGGVRFLFTGDANGKARDQTNANLTGHVEAKLLELEKKVPGTLRTDVLKVPHHGSETSSTNPFINAVDPRFVIISASTTHHLSIQFGPERAQGHRHAERRANQSDG